MIASIEGEGTLGVLDEDYNLHIVSKIDGLITGARCWDITEAAKSLNNDYGKLTELSDRIKELETELKLTQEELAQYGDLSPSTRNELTEEIENLKKQNERLIKTSRMWQDVIAQLRKQLEEQ